MRRLLLILAAASLGCGAEGGPPPAKHAYAAKAVEEYVRKISGGGRKARVHAWGASWEATPAHIAFLKKNGNAGMWFDPDRSFPDGVAAYAQEVTLLSWPEGRPDAAVRTRHLFVFEPGGRLLTDFMPVEPPGAWRKRIPDDPGREP